jgi:hypothetical protein
MNSRTIRSKCNTISWQKVPRGDLSTSVGISLEGCGVTTLCLFCTLLRTQFHCNNTGRVKVAQQPKSGLGRLLLEVSRSNSDTPRSVGLLWTSDQPVAETSTRQHTNTHKRQTSMRPAFEPTIPVCARPKVNAVDRAATGIGTRWFHSTRDVVTARYCSVLLQKRVSTQQHKFLDTNVDPAIGQYPTTHSSGSLDVTDDTDHGLYYHKFNVFHVRALYYTKKL